MSFQADFVHRHVVLSHSYLIERADQFPNAGPGTKYLRIAQGSLEITDV